jgi:glycosyltransferase involved in cell wall biosynthesis
MACYQGEKYLAIQLESLLAQDYPNLEFICVDDASSDATWQMLEKYAALDSRVNIHKNATNLGYRKTFEKGITWPKVNSSHFPTRTIIGSPSKFQNWQRQ